jgi:hypothetical protein
VGIVKVNRRSVPASISWRSTPSRPTRYCTRTQPDSRERTPASALGRQHRRAGDPWPGFREDRASLHCAVARIRNARQHRHPATLRATRQHVVDELFWQDKIVPALGRIRPNARWHPAPRSPGHPRSSPGDGGDEKWQPRVGVELDIARVRSQDASKQVRVYVDFSHACSNSTCKLLNNMQGKTYNDDRVMFMIEVTGL